MYLLILCIIICIIVAWINYKEDELNSGIFIIIFIFCGLITLIGRSILDEKHSYKQYMDLPIVSLNVDKQLEGGGSFVLGIGGVSLEPATYYVAYGEFSRGLKRVKIDAYNTYINETNTEKPRIKNYWYRMVGNPYKSNWFWGRSEIKYGKWYTTSEWVDDIIITVPTNTIYKEFKIDK